MILVDTHCHLADRAFEEDRSAVVERARAAGVAHIVVVGESLEASRRALDVASEFDLSCTAGVHPHDAASWGPEAAAALAEMVRDEAVVAVGETGLDYYYEHAPRAVQRQAFAAQLALAADVGKPVVIHARDADADMCAMLRDAPTATLVMHSFSCGDAVLEAALAQDAYISFSGMITFKRWEGDGWVRAVSDDRILIETDGPYLAPVPHRGKRNEPQFLPATAARAAEVREVGVDNFAQLTTTNAVRCFALSRAVAEEET